MARISKAGLILTGVALFLSTVEPAKAELTVPNVDTLSLDFRARVVSVSAFGLLQFEGIGFRRLWGLQIEQSMLEDLVLGRELVCDEIGLGSHPIANIGGPPVICGALEGVDLPAGFVSFLLDQGIAKEVCSETRNWFKTCKERD